MADPGAGARGGWRILRRARKAGVRSSPAAGVAVLVVALLVRVVALLVRAVVGASTVSSGAAAVLVRVAVGEVPPRE